MIKILKKDDIVISKQELKKLYMTNLLTYSFVIKNASDRYFKDNDKNKAYFILSNMTELMNNMGTKTFKDMLKTDSDLLENCRDVKNKCTKLFNILEENDDGALKG